MIYIVIAELKVMGKGNPIMRLSGAFRRKESAEAAIMADRRHALTESSMRMLGLKGIQYRIIRCPLS
jgi:hypothetical protein